MSRCFPYPPPGYSRNGATYEALIESIKLQKENGKAKSERKKEKKEKKAKKEKREKEAKTKLQKNPNEYKQDAHKVLQSSADFKEAHNKTTKPSIEQLEKSNVTEEHGQPISSHKPSYSSDSTQNSNKRKRDDAILPDGSSSHGKPIKIRLLKKPSGTDSSKETLCSSSGRPDPSFVSSNRNSDVPATSGRESNASEGFPNLGRPGVKNIIQQGLHFGKQQFAPASALKLETGTSNQSRQQPVSNHLTPGISSSGLIKTKPYASRKRSINEIMVPDNSGPTGFDKKKEDSISKRKKSGLTQAEKKMRKKHLKYEKLMGSWTPVVIEAGVFDGGDDEDWLSRSGKTARSSSRDDVETCRESAAASSLWQPCARFLADAGIHALPYTVPF